MKIYLHPNRIKKVARAAVHAAVRAKTIKRACRCEICQYSIRQLLIERDSFADRFTQPSRQRFPLAAHHHNYYKPYNVWWLCDFCHMTLHRAQEEFNFICLTLEHAKTTVGNYSAWRNKDGYQGYINKEIEWARKELEILERRKQRLQVYLSRLTNESL